MGWCFLGVVGREIVFGVEVADEEGKGYFWKTFQARFRTLRNSIDVCKFKAFYRETT
jgi:hypothetical protein